MTPNPVDLRRLREAAERLMAARERSRRDSIDGNPKPMWDDVEQIIDYALRCLPRPIESAPLKRPIMLIRCVGGVIKETFATTIPTDGAKKEFAELGGMSWAELPPVPEVP